jgi:hypothetical protein
MTRRTLISTTATVAQVSVGFIGGITASFLGPHMNQAKDRQLARTAATEKIADLEGILWTENLFTDFQKAVGSFRASAIGARIPKGWVDAYIGICKTLYGMRQHERPDNMPEIEYQNVLEALDNRASEYADAIVTVMWHPLRPRMYSLLLRRSTGRAVTRARAILADDYGYTDPILGRTLRAWERGFTDAEPSSS